MIAAAEVRLVAGGTEANITSGCHFHRLIGRFTPAGLHLWCRGCRAEELITWEEMEQVRRSLALRGKLCYPDL